uniref:Major facilitator superfamily (MFS) profile domain-containing protein n=1 Tax=Timema shepardi TaxID=629360 RepID=A0A7R9G733_TIMSH|nr:unnamed protein product [Timema shepardi]
MSGNPFTNFFWQSLVELPGFVFGRYLSDKFGRRWTHTAAFIVVAVILIVIILLVNRNPFTNFFWQSLVELPGFVFGRYLSDKFGRRWTHTAAFIVVAVILIVIILLVNKPELNWLLVTMVVSIKFVTSISGYTCSLQAMEIFPTCVRQTGCSLGSSAASIVGTLGPYILYLGSVTDKRYTYAIMGLGTCLAAVASFYLPETMNQKLPETLADAAVFGKDQKYWSLYQESNITFDGTDVPPTASSPASLIHSSVMTPSIYSSPVASLVLTDSSQTSDSQHLDTYSSPVASLVLTDSSQLTSDSQHLDTYSSPVASLVLTDSSQLTSDSKHLGIYSSPVASLGAD